MMRSEYEIGLRPYGVLFCLVFRDRYQMRRRCQTYPCQQGFVIRLAEIRLKANRPMEDNHYNIIDCIQMFRLNTKELMFKSDWFRGLFVTTIALQILTFVFLWVWLTTYCGPYYNYCKQQEDRQVCFYGGSPYCCFDCNSPSPINGGCFPITDTYQYHCPAYGIAMGCFAGLTFVFMIVVFAMFCELHRRSQRGVNPDGVDMINPLLSFPIPQSTNQSNKPNPNPDLPSNPPPSNPQTNVSNNSQPIGHIEPKSNIPSNNAQRRMSTFDGYTRPRPTEKEPLAFEPALE